MVQGFIGGREYTLYALAERDNVTIRKDAFIALDVVNPSKLMDIPENVHLFEFEHTLWANLEEWPEGEFPSAGISGTIVATETPTSDESFLLVSTAEGWGLYHAEYGTIYLPKECIVPVQGSFIYYLVSNTLRLMVDRDRSCYERNG